MFEKVRTIVVEQLGVEPEEVTREARLDEDLGADSLDAVQLTLELEEMFSIEIPDRDAVKLRTVSEIIAYLDARVSAAT